LAALPNAANVSAMVHQDTQSIRRVSSPGVPPMAWPGEQLKVLRWIFFARGGLALVAGILLLVWPDRTLLLVGVILGVFLVAFGVLEMVRALASPGMLAMERVIPATLGLLAVGAGTIAIARPESSVLAVALAAGIYLVVAGLAAGVSAVREPDSRLPRAVLALVDLAAGILVIAWPDVTVTVVAVVLGIALVVRGVAEIILGVYIRRKEKP
jgi:uncharacterized membrane protein HdeD (DUF308 family)